MSIGNEYLQSVIKRLKYYRKLGEITLDRLTEDDLHFQPNAEANSIAIIIQHMAGNMLSRWTDFLTGDGEKEWRTRDAEFEEQHLSKEQLLGYWNKGWDCCLDVLNSLTEEDLLKTIYIRKEGLIAIDAINRQFAHYPYHVGQIIHIAKTIKADKWESLSIAKGQSEEYTRQMHAKS